MLRRMNFVKIAVFVVAIGVVTTVTRPANAIFGIPEIVSDAANNIQLIESVRESVQKAIQQIQQLDQLRKSIQNIVHLNMPDIVDGFNKVNDALGRVQDQAKELSKYPTQFQQELSNVDMEKIQEKGSQAIRDFADKVKESADEIGKDRQAVADRIQAIVNASNGAEGQKAALQAHNNLMSVLANEQSKLSAIRSLRSRLQEEIRARAQSTEALIKKYNEQAVESLKVLTGE